VIASSNPDPLEGTIWERFFVEVCDGKKASVLQLIDTENNNEKALVKDLIS
jgi:hypothetical protein